MATVYYTATSLDGYIADEHNSLEWLFEVDREHESGDTSFTKFFSRIGAMAMGATTYLWVLDHENLLEEPERWRGYYGDTPCWVFTHRELPTIPDVDVRFVQDDVLPVHEDMCVAAQGKDVWLVGGGDLVGQFADEALLDEIIVGIAPVTLGAGAPLLPRRMSARQLELLDVRRDRQFVNVSYRVRHA
ncbi:MAG TPA: dihydrofolate reductase family protein [Gaiellaceae bacterium]|nr:dihydrofolate reductase family protein [Gaiellaceae bacterium]